MSKQLVVIGGGAAGFFSAINAARLNPDLTVIILEKTNKLLSKVRVSGGGRCNVTHACFDIDKMSSQYPRGKHFVRKAFHRFFTYDTIQWFEERKVKLKTEADGRMFPVTDSSQTIIDCFRSEAEKYGVKIMLNSEVKNLKSENGLFKILLTDSRSLTADFVINASGGYPKDEMFNWLKETGHMLEEPVPSLFTFNLPGHPITHLMGLSADPVKVKISGSRLEQTGSLLITHWGLSGPVILKLSAWGARELAVSGYDFRILVNWLPDLNIQEVKQKFQHLRFDFGSKKVSGKNSFGLPHRLWEFLLEHSGVNKETRWADLPAKEENRLINILNSCELNVKGKTTYKEEFVTAGGIKLREVDAHTMMSKKISNLFFAGEVLDVDGITGGYNFQHAWTSGWIAARQVADLSR